MDVDDDKEIVSDEITALMPLRASKKIVSISIGSYVSTYKYGHTTTLTDRILISENNNSLCVYSFELPIDVCDNDSKLTTYDPYQSLTTLQLPGHRSGIRSTSISSDSGLLLSCSSEHIKLWNVATGTCVRTMVSGYGLCSAFIPGNKHVVIGTKNGELELWEINSNTCIEKIQAHDGPVWTIDIRPDQRYVI